MNQQTKPVKEDEIKAPEAPIHYNNEESFAWQSGWKTGYAAAQKSEQLTPVDGWIDVKEWLPKNKQEVSVYFKNEVGWHVTGAYFDGKWFNELCEVCGHKEPFTIVTHWRPLPLAPDSTPTPLEAGKPDRLFTLDEMIGFADWISDCQMKRYSKGWCGAGGSNGWHCTTKELVEIFINEDIDIKNNQP